MKVVRDAAGPLAPADARYHLVAAAWSQAWLDLTDGRPWRKRFALAIRDLGPFEVPARLRLWMAVQQLAAPIACLVASPVMAFLANR